MSETTEAHLENVRDFISDDHREYVAAEDEPRGKRAAAVANIIDQLVEAEGHPMPTRELLANAEADVSQMGPALLALELTGIVRRFTFVDKTGTKSQTAYALIEQEA